MAQRRQNRKKTTDNILPVIFPKMFSRLSLNPTVFALLCTRESIVNKGRLIKVENTNPAIAFSIPFPKGRFIIVLPIIKTDVRAK